MLQVRGDSVLLVIGNRKVVAESATRVNDLFTSILLINNGSSRAELRCADCSHVGARSGKTGVENCAVHGLSACAEYLSKNMSFCKGRNKTIWIQAKFRVARDAIVP